MRAERWSMVVGALALAAAVACGSGGGAQRAEVATHRISGTFTGGQVEGVRVTLGGAAEGSTVTDAAGHYAFDALADGEYTVTPSMTGCAFSPASVAVTVTGADATADFVCTVEVASRHVIQGDVTGAVQEGVTVTLSGAASRSTVTDATGHYAFTALADGEYDVTPSRAGYSFDPVGAAVTVAGADQTVDFVCTAEVPGPYAIAGGITGDVQAGITVTLSGTRSRQVVTGADGRYRFEGLPDGHYVVTATLGHWWIQGSPWPLDITFRSPDPIEFRSRILFDAYRVAGSLGDPTHLVAGPDGAIWFTDLGTHSIGRIAMDGTVSEYPLPEGSIGPLAIVSGPGDVLWYTDRTVGRVTTGGVLTPYPMFPDPDDGAARARPYYIVSAGGFLYFAAMRDEFSNVEETFPARGFVGRCSTGGVCEDSGLRFTGFPDRLALGPDGAVWFTSSNGVVGKVTSGEVFEYPLWTQTNPPVHIAAGPDGNMWVTHLNNGLLSKVSVSGALLAEYDVGGGQPLANIVVRRDGTMWVGGPRGIVRVDPSGIVTARYSVIVNSLLEDWRPGEYTEGPDGALWCTAAGGQILRLTPP